MKRQTVSSQLLTAHLLTGGAGFLAGVLALQVMESDGPTWAAMLARSVGLSLPLAKGSVIVLFVLIVLTALSLFVLWIGLQRTTEFRSRLSLLADASAAYAAGRLQHQLLLPGEDDVALIATHVSSMVATIQDQVRALQETAANLNARQRDLEIQATVKERERVQRELHDRVSQDLFGLSMLCNAANMQREKKPELALALLPELSELSRRTQASMRSLLLELRPMQLGEQTLVSALKGLTSELAERTGLQITASFSCWDGAAEAQLPQGVEDALFLIAQEAVLNALRHSGGTRIHVALYCERGRAVLSVTDDGAGFAEPPSQTGGSHHYTSVGLRSMSERAQLVGGTLGIQSGQEHGTEVLTIIPLIGE